MAFPKDRIEANRAYFAQKLSAVRQKMDLVRRHEGGPGDFLLLDVRGHGPFAAGHIRGARSVPVDRLSEHLDELPRDRELVVYCWTEHCQLAAQAALRLSEAGYFVRELNTGWREWLAAGHATHQAAEGADICECSFRVEGGPDPR
jgi:rhodanese-related sulfurtransferase